MKPKKKKRKNNPGARERLLKAALELFAERGYAGTFVREIVARAGVTKPVLYYYFEHKQGLFYAILDEAAAQQRAVLEEVLKTPGTIMERFSNLFQCFYHGLMENKDLVRMIHILFFGPPQGVPEYDLDQYRRSMTSAIKAIYQDGLEKDEVKQAYLGSEEEE